LLIATISGMVIVAFAGTAILMSYQEQNHAYQQSEKLTSRYIAEAGQARVRQLINLMFVNGQLTFTDVDKRLQNMSFFKDEPWLAPQGNQSRRLGDYSVASIILTPTEIKTTEDITGDKITSVRYITVESTGTIRGEAGKIVQSKVKITYKLTTEVARVFDYCYFINNWGWFYDSGITTFGDVRSNGSFSFGGYRPTIWGKPRFESSNGIDLIGYIDDNLDGSTDNQDGGVYAWNYIDGTPSANGRPSDLYAGLQGKSPIYDMPQLPMPNLTNLNFYEQKAKEQGSYVKINGVTVCDGIWGDNEGKQNLYLEGTYEKPIEINGTIVVRGDLIIRGYVKGQGTFYCGRNIYIPQRILYRNPPAERRPSNNSESARENWRATNWNTDLLGLFSREHIVISDYTSSTWQSYVSSWINDPANQSKEDSGLDSIPNTYDSGENDRVWTVLRDSAGNPIPGTGEDIDGDGKYDGTTQLSEFNLASGTFYTGHPEWGGNIPANVTTFRQVTYWDETLDAPGISGSQKFPQVDAVLYTNHFLGGYFDNRGGYSYKNDNRTHFQNLQEITFNGAIISRNESMIFDANGIVIQHDERLSATGGEMFNFTLPRIWKPLKVISIE